MHTYTLIPSNDEPYLYKNNETGAVFALQDIEACVEVDRWGHLKIAVRAKASGDHKEAKEYLKQYITVKVSPR